MKKVIIFLAAAAGVALAGCVKNTPEIAPAGREVAVSFSPIAQRSLTKAPYYGEQNAYYTGDGSSYEDFLAHSFYTAQASSVGGFNPQGTVASNNGGEFFPAAGVECSHAGTAPADWWEPATPYYWPRAGYLHFHALSPYVFTKSALSHAWASGYAITGYQAPVYADADLTDAQTANNQIDLLYSDFVFDRQRSGYDPQTGSPYDESGTAPYLDAASHKGVDLTFRHALASVNFKTKTAADYESGTQRHQFIVRKIEILKAYNTADFAENRAATADNAYLAVADMTGKVGFTKENADGSLTPYWSNFSNEVASIVAYDATDAAATGTVAGAALSAGIGTPVIALPQPLDHGANQVQLRVTYDYRFSMDGGTSWIEYGVAGGNALVSLLDLGGFQGVYDPSGANEAGYVVDNWLINHRYTYNLVFRLDPIIFDPKVEAWVEVSDIDIDLPYQN